MRLPHANSIYKIHNPIRIRRPKRLCLGLSHLNEYNIRQNFTDCANPLCSSSIKPENTLHLFLHFHSFLNIRTKLVDKMKLLDEKLLQLNEESLLLFGNKTYNK